MSDYISAKGKDVFAFNGLASFENLWEVKLDAVDTPNSDRGGWSSVCRMELPSTDGNKVACFIKRQTNHITYSLTHPFGEPTFAKEFRNIQLYKKKSVPTVDPLFFAQRKTTQGTKAILVTCALDDYTSLDKILKVWDGLETGVRQSYISAIANTVGLLHKERISHRCLYPKHIFVSETDPIPIRLIDLENAKLQIISNYGSIRDIETLLRRIEIWTQNEMNQFIREYLVKSQVNIDEKLYLQQILKRRIRHLNS